ncbi:MAG: B-box zinc finger protein [Acidimicrobiales bacterium]
MRHFEEPVTALCKNCQRPFCERCLVYSFGPKKPPYCVRCALSASGVRNTKVVPVGRKVSIGAGGPEAVVAAGDKRLARAERRASKSAGRAAARSTRRAKGGPGPVVSDGSLPVASPNDAVPAPSDFVGAHRYGDLAQHV